ncbi:MAG TPA: primosomal protein N' [Clostridiales bacterium]|nr:primosomal protein N' [Clostridiales bacterium]
MRYVKVIINKKITSLDHDFVYEVPPELWGEVGIGSVVAVPFGHTTEKGIVVGFCDEPGDYRIKHIDGLLNDAFSVPVDLLKLADTLSKYYMNTTIGMIKAMIPTGINLFGKALKEKTEPWLFFQETGQNSIHLRGPKQRGLYALMESKKEARQKELSELGFSPVVIKSLMEKGVLHKEYLPVSRYSYRHLTPEHQDKPVLTREQEAALGQIKANQKGENRPVLLHGVTGSGKTEIYLRLIEETLNRGKQAIVLLPEIALTPQFVRVFEKRFHGEVALLHSRLSAGERRDAWYALANGDAAIALGARSCIFAPTPNLGLIIIDEEHEDSYEQDTAPRFHSRVAALMRCELRGAALVLGSATPSFESYKKALNGEYLLVEMENRVGGGALPEMSIVDMREELKAGWAEVLSRELLSQMKAALAAKKQVMLFLNRLGYHTFVSCRDCGFVYRCPDCAVSLTYFRKGQTLKCTRCGYMVKLANVCPDCGSKRIKYFGLGTEQLEEVVRKHFPDAKIGRLDSEQTKAKGSFDRIYEAMKNGEIDILIGTRMMAKGWDFANVALTGIIAADYTLNFPDFRAGERTFQMIAQAAGRCGRGRERGTVILQSYRPEEPALLFGGQQNYEAYYYWEAKRRKKYGYPPFTHLMKAVMTTPADYLNREELEEMNQIFAAESGETVRVFGPTPGIYRDQGKDKWVVTLIGDDLSLLREGMKRGISRLKSEKIIDKNFNIQIETEPMHTV